MRHKAYRKLIIYLVSVGVITASLSGNAWSPYAFAQQLQSSASQPTTAQVKQDPATSIRKPHRLIRKSQNQPLASVQQSPSGTTNLSPLTTTPTTSSNNAALSQPVEPSPTEKAIRGFSTMSPLTTMAIGSISMAAPTASPSVSTPSSQAPLPLASANGGGSSSDTRRSGGRSMRSLAAQMPLLAEVLSPPSLSATPPPPSTPTPAIGLSPLALSFTAVQNGAAPTSQSVTIANVGTGTLSWTASSNMAWLKVNSATSATGTNAGTLTVSVNQTGLTTGTQTGMISITASGATNTPQSIPVSFTVTAAPAIGASPSSLSFTAQQSGSNPAAQTLTISNTGGGTLSWTASDNTPWLTVSPASGTGNGTITVSATLSPLATGTYNGVITLSATGASAVTIPVTFTITAPPTVSVSPSSLTYTATQSAANPASQTVTVGVTGGTLSWTASDNAAWLSVTPGTGSGSGTITASVNTASLTPGTYSGTITVAGAGVTSQTVSVALTVNAPATSSVTLTWIANTEPDLLSYNIYRSTTPGVYGAPLTNVLKPATSYSVTGLLVGTTYYFTITAVDSAGNESLRSNEVSRSIF